MTALRAPEGTQDSQAALPGRHARDIADGRPHLQKKFVGGIWGYGRRRENRGSRRTLRSEVGSRRRQSPDQVKRSVLLSTASRLSEHALSPEPVMNRLDLINSPPCKHDEPRASTAMTGTQSQAERATPFVAETKRLSSISAISNYANTSITGIHSRAENVVQLPEQSTLAQGSGVPTISESTGFRAQTSTMARPKPKGQLQQKDRMLLFAK